MLKDEVIEAILEIAPDAEIGDKTKAELETMLDGLQALQPAPADDSDSSDEPTPAADSSDEPTPAADSSGTYTVCDGCAITTKRGVLTAGDTLTADDLAGGVDAARAQVAANKIK